MLGKLFLGGMGDYLVIDNLSARNLVSKNADLVTIVSEMVVDGGDIPWSVCYYESGARTPAVLDQQRRFCTALAQGMEWVLEHDAEIYRDELVELFPHIEPDVAVELCNVFRRNGMWTSPEVDVAGYER